MKALGGRWSQWSLGCQCLWQQDLRAGMNDTHAYVERADTQVTYIGLQVILCTCARWPLQRKVSLLGDRTSWQSLPPWLATPPLMDTSSPVGDCAFVLACRMACACHAIGYPYAGCSPSPVFARTCSTTVTMHVVLSASAASNEVLKFAGSVGTWMGGQAFDY
jgi:hypothetical protein